MYAVKRHGNRPPGNGPLCYCFRLVEYFSRSVVVIASLLAIYPAVVPVAVAVASHGTKQYSRTARSDIIRRLCLALRLTKMVTRCS